MHLADIYVEREYQTFAVESPTDMDKREGYGNSTINAQAEGGLPRPHDRKEPRSLARPERSSPPSKARTQGKTWRKITAIKVALGVSNAVESRCVPAWRTFTKKHRESHSPEPNPI